MKKLCENSQKQINGGGHLHYHWFCDLNGFRSAGYYSYSICVEKMREHANKYDHSVYMSIMECTGNCRMSGS